jgi:hypothetical protein
MKALTAGRYSERNGCPTIFSSLEKKYAVKILRKERQIRFTSDVKEGK